MKETRPIRTEKVSNAIKMKMLKLINFLWLVIFMSCSSAQKVDNDDFYNIVNIMLYEAKEKRDSVHIIDWKSNNYYQQSEEVYDGSDYSILKFKKTVHVETFAKLEQYFTKYGINLNDEIAYFREQIEDPFELNREKLLLKELKIFPSNTDWYKIKYNNKFTNYYYVLGKPLITKNGQLAIYYHEGSDYANFFTILMKENSKWRIVDKFNANRIGLD